MPQTGPLASPSTSARELRSHQPESPPEKSPPRRRGRGLLVLLLVVLAAICVVGAPYYLQPMAARVRSPWHPWLKSSGYVGQGAGLLALVLFLFLWLYPLRKKFRWLAFTGTLARWLNAHVLAALSLPLLVAVHAAWRFTGVIGLGFWSMMVVWLSGIVGRYIYARIPRGKAGVELSIEEIGKRRQILLEQVVQRSGLDLATVERVLALGTNSREPLGIWGTFKRMVADDFARRRAARRLRRLWESRGPRRRAADRATIHAVLRLASQEVGLAQQARMLDATHAVFRYWHVFHRPVAFAALMAVLVHVAVVVALGATWLW
ncbi:MAG: hypothetical protein ACREMI_05810 [Gemmatimonadales bacterium]